MSMIISIYNIKKKTHTHQLLKGKKYKVHRFLMISKRKFKWCTCTSWLFITSKCVTCVPFKLTPGTIPGF